MCDCCSTSQHSSDRVFALAAPKLLDILQLHCPGTSEEHEGKLIEKELAASVLRTCATCDAAKTRILQSNAAAVLAGLLASSQAPMHANSVTRGHVRATLRNLAVYERAATWQVRAAREVESLLEGLGPADGAGVPDELRQATVSQETCLLECILHDMHWWEERGERWRAQSGSNAAWLPSKEQRYPSPKRGGTPHCWVRQPGAVESISSFLKVTPTSELSKRCAGALGCVSVATKMELVERGAAMPLAMLLGNGASSALAQVRLGRGSRCSYRQASRRQTRDMRWVLIADSCVELVTTSNWTRGRAVPLPPRSCGQIQHWLGSGFTPLVLFPSSCWLARRHSLLRMALLKEEVPTRYFKLKGLMLVWEIMFLCTCVGRNSASGQANVILHFLSMYRCVRMHVLLVDFPPW